MSAFARNTTCLLEGLADPAQVEAWFEFDSRYRPVVHAFARRLGLKEADAEDVAQETLTRFLSSYRAGRYDHTRGRLSTWIVSIARHCVLDLHRLHAERRGWRGESALLDLADEGSLIVLWDEECRRRIMDLAMRDLREGTRFDERTIRAFELVAFEEKPPADVAELLAMSVDSVYTAKNRCLTYLREAVTRLHLLYEVA